MPRRKDSEIYSYKLKSGKAKYGFKTYIGINKETGKAVKITRQGFATRKEAEQAKIKAKASGTGNIVNKQNSKKELKTVTDVWNIWSEIYKQNVRGSTYTHAQRIWKSNLKAEFGNDYISHVSVDHIQRFANECAKKYVTYNLMLNLLKRLIEYSIIRGWVDRNPFDKVIIPKKSAKKSRNNDENFYNQSEMNQFLAAAKSEGLTYYTFFMILGNLGLRRGEGLALKWSDFDFKNKTVHIQRTVTLDYNGRTDIGPTKTSNGDRILSLSDNLLDVLRKYEESEKPFISEYLFHKRNSSQHYTDYEAGNLIRKIYKDNSQLRKITPHGLRHTLATLLYEGSEKITPKDVQYVLGHSKPDIALDIYTHITEKQKKNIVDSINNLNFK